MAKMKTTKKYYFSVEGETEQWYLKWLQDRINETEESKIKVSFDCAVQKNPLKRAKSMVITGKTEVWHSGVWCKCIVDALSHDVVAEISSWFIASAWTYS